MKKIISANFFKPTYFRDGSTIRDMKTLLQNGDKESAAALFRFSKSNPDFQICLSKYLEDQHKFTTFIINECKTTKLSGLLSDEQFNESIDLFYNPN